MTTLSPAERSALILQFRPLAHHVLRRHGPRDLTREERQDLLGEIMVGIVEAANSYDPGRGASFKTHAYWKARGRLTRALKHLGRSTLRMGVSVIQTKNGMQLATDIVPGRVEQMQRSTWTKAQWRVVLSKLDADSAKVVELRFFNGLTVAQTAWHLGLFRPTVGKICAQALETIRRIFPEREVLEGE